MENIENIINNIAVITKANTIEIRKQKIREIKDDEALVRVKSSSICGSDLHLYKGLHPSVKLPSTVGHEFSGDIVYIGKDNHGFKVNDRVTLEPIINCGHCKQCLSGNYGLCENATFSYRIGDGAMANYVVCKTSHLFKLDDDMSYDVGSLIEPLSVASRAVKRSNAKENDKVLVMGVGTIGLFITAILKYKGIKDITTVDFATKRLEASKKYGAKYILNPLNKNTVEELYKIHPQGYDVCFECIGKEITFKNCLDVLAVNGTLLQVGIFENPNVNFNISSIITKQLTIKGTQGYNNDFLQAIELAKNIDFSKLITHIYPLDKIQEAFECSINATKTDALKVIIHP